MKLTRLVLANVRAIEAAEFCFRSGFNLIAGVNGAGKTTVLDALAVCLSVITVHANRQRRNVLSFRGDDVRVGVGALQVECGFEFADETYVYTLHMPRKPVVLPKEMAELSRMETGRTPTPKIEQFHPGIPTESSSGSPDGRPMAVLFSTNRAAPSERAPAKGAAAGGISAALSGALSNRRGLHLAEFEAWMRGREALSAEQPAAKRVLAAFEIAVERFLPGYRNLRVGGESPRGGILLVDHGDTTLPVRSLSDGERGVLAMVLDLTRRLAQANPETEDPAAEAEAVVLIDEIELHLHPEWQRRIVENLTKTFPKCQFIATTHSPQVIGEVPHDRIHIMSGATVYSPTHSFGVDSSRVLEDIMDTDPRTKKVKDLLSEISRAIGDDRYDHARKLLADLAKHLGEDDPEVTRIRILLDFMTGDA